jgi:mannose-6-phosphate isomerase-like protein (cupin superfamily)
MVKNTSNAGHYIWGNNCQSYKLCDHDDLSVKQEIMPPNTSEEKHYHKIAKQFFYILKGKASFNVANETFHIHSGEGIEILSGIPHKIENRENENLEFLVISSPSTEKDRYNAIPIPKS